MCDASSARDGNLRLPCRVARAKILAPAGHDSFARVQTLAGRGRPAQGRSVGPSRGGRVRPGPSYGRASWKRSTPPTAHFVSWPPCIGRPGGGIKPKSLAQVYQAICRSRTASQQGTVHGPVAGPAVIAAACQSGVRLTAGEAHDNRLPQGGIDAAGQGQATMPIGSGHSSASLELGRIALHGAIGKRRLASARISTALEGGSSGSATRPSPVGGWQPATTSWRPTTSHSSNLRFKESAT